MRIPALLVAMAITLPAFARDTRTTIGRVDSPIGGSVTLSVQTLGNSKAAIIFVSDKHIISTNRLVMNKARLLQLRDLIDETIDELDAAPAQQLPEEAKP